MESIQFVLKIALVLFIFIVIVKIFMMVAAHVGEQLGFGRFFMYLWRKIRKK